MNPIVDPWTIYWVMILPMIKQICIVLAVVWLPMWMMLVQQNTVEITTVRAIVILVIQFILIVTAIMLPTKDVVLMMYGASVATPDNLEAVKHFITK